RPLRSEARARARVRGEAQILHGSPPGAGSFCCSETELGFEVRAAVTIQYGYNSWDGHLSASEKQQWMVSGPLFNIRVEPAGAVAAVHFPSLPVPQSASSHLYLIPNDRSLIQAADEEEKKHQSIQVLKPPQTKPLYFGSCYTVSSSLDLEVTLE
ncbi:unnamed protein product, partial [Lepidochelys kempii]